MVQVLLAKECECESTCESTSTMTVTTAYLNYIASEMHKKLSFHVKKKFVHILILGVNMILTYSERANNNILRLTA